MRSEIALLLLCGLTLMSGGCDRRSQPDGQAAGQANSAAPTAGEVPPQKDARTAPQPTMGRIDRSKAGEEAPDLIFTGPDGKDVALDRLKGKALVVNLWATWCGPCVEEMPTLDALAKKYGGAGLMVLPVSQDSGEPAQIATFLKEHNLPNLAIYRDPENQLGFHYNTGMLPTTVVYDRDGKEVARVVGAMDWSGAAAADLVREAME